ncbi:hypothetical protein ACHAXT_009668 [Thalassiosira profunda]
MVEKKTAAKIGLVGLAVAALVIGLSIGLTSNNDRSASSSAKGMEDMYAVDECYDEMSYSTKSAKSSGSKGGKSGSISMSYSAKSSKGSGGEARRLVVPGTEGYAAGPEKRRQLRNEIARGLGEDAMSMSKSSKSSDMSVSSKGSKSDMSYSSKASGSKGAKSCPKPDDICDTGKSGKSGSKGSKADSSFSYSGKGGKSGDYSLSYSGKGGKSGDYSLSYSGKGGKSSGSKGSKSGPPSICAPGGCDCDDEDRQWIQIKGADTDDRSCTFAECGPTPSPETPQPTYEPTSGGTDTVATGAQSEQTQDGSRLPVVSNDE